MHYLTKAQISYGRILKEEIEPKVPVNNFKDEAKMMNIFDVDKFLKSTNFNSKFRIVEGNIIRNF